MATLPTVTDQSNAALEALREQSEVVKKAAEPSDYGDFETFVKLLTSQLENQDPLEPLDSTEFVSQLASFSAVEQQVATNSKLDSLIATVAGGDAQRLSQWLGQNVAASGAPAFFKGDPISFTAPGAPDVANVAVVANAAGDEVARYQVDRSEELVWDGQLTGGGQAAEGLYTINLVRFDGSDIAETFPTTVFGDVREVRAGPNSQLTLVLEGGATLSPDQVIAVR